MRMHHHPGKAAQTMTIIRVAFPTGNRAYTYLWPLEGGPLDVGDLVRVPVTLDGQEGEETGVVVGFGSEYTGPVKVALGRADR